MVTDRWTMFGIYSLEKMYAVLIQQYFIIVIIIHVAQDSADMGISEAIEHSRYQYLSIGM